MIWACGVKGISKIQFHEMYKGLIDNFSTKYP